MTLLIEIYPEQESKFAAMLRAGGVAVWINTDPISPSKGRAKYTPHDALAPANGYTRERIVTNPAEVGVRQFTEHSRVEISDSVNSRGLNRRDMDAVTSALKAAGNGAIWRSDWSRAGLASGRHDAVILVPAKSRAINMEGGK